MTALTPSTPDRGGKPARRRLTAEDIARIAELREAGKTYRQIAEAIGCSEGAVQWQCTLLGVETPTPILIPRGNHVMRLWTPSEDRKLLRLERQGLGSSAIGHRMGRAHGSVLARLRTLARRDERREASDAR